VAEIETPFSFGRRLGYTDEKLSDRLLDVLGNVERMPGSSPAKAATEGFFARAWLRSARAHPDAISGR
jgi:hypothetical protein